MKKNDIEASIHCDRGKGQKLFYSAPQIQIFGDAGELTRANGKQPPTDSETTVSGPVSP